ncbi:MAG TPA: hypothetical protein VIF37_00835 [Methylobacter sp.]|jgi:hypothetical protein
MVKAQSVQTRFEERISYTGNKIAHPPGLPQQFLLSRQADEIL